jgi:hypothetical protein
MALHPNKAGPESPHWEQLKINQNPDAPAGEPPDPDRIINYSMPMWLLIGGVIMEMLSALMNARGFSAAISQFCTELIGRTALLVGCVFFAAGLRRFSLGKVNNALFKLIAISVVTLAVYHLANPFLLLLPSFALITHLLAVPTALIVGWGLQILLFFILLGVMFDLEEDDTRFCVALIFIASVALHFVSLWLGYR